MNEPNETNEWCGNCDTEQTVYHGPDVDPSRYNWTCDTCGMEIATYNDEEVTASIVEAWAEDAAFRASRTAAA